MICPALEIQLSCALNENLSYLWNSGERLSFWSTYCTFPEPKRLSLQKTFTACKRSCVKVMFSEVSVCQWVTSHASWDRSNGRVLPGISYFPATGILRSLLERPEPPLLLTSGGHHREPVQTFTWGPTPHPHCCWYLVQANEAGSTHPTGMLSYAEIVPQMEKCWWHWQNNFSGSINN